MIHQQIFLHIESDFEAFLIPEMLDLLAQFCQVEVNMVPILTYPPIIIILVCLYVCVSVCIVFKMGIINENLLKRKAHLTIKQASLLMLKF